MARLSATTTTVDDAALTTGILNRVASGATRTSPRKRARISNYNTASPNKRRKPTPPSDTIEVPRKLQTKGKSLGTQSVQPRRGTRTSVYDVPDDEREELSVDSSNPAPKLLRPLTLNRTKVSFPNGGVDPLSSPRENGSSPVKVRRSRMRTNESIPTQPARNDESKRQRGRPKQTAAALPETRDVDKTPEPRGSSGAKTPAKKTNRGSRTEQASGVGERSHESRNGQAAGRDQSSSKDAKHVRQLDESGSRSSSESENDPPAASPVKRQAAKAKVRAEVAKQGETQLLWRRGHFRDFEQQSSLHGCRVQWKGMLKAANLNRDTVLRPGSAEIKKFEELIKSTIKLMNEATENPTDKDDFEVEISARLRRVKKESKRFRPTEDVEHNLTLNRDLYTVAIPALVFLAKALVSYRFQHETLTSGALEEIVDVLKSGYYVCEIVGRWKPKATNLDQGVVGDTRSVIKISMAEIQKKYLEAQEILDRPRREQERREFYERQWRERDEEDRLRNEKNTRDLEEKRRRLAEECARRAADPTARHRSHPELGSSQPIRQPITNILDIDDLDIGDATHVNGTISKFDTGQTISAHHTLPGRSRLRLEREKTEEIPAPSQCIPAFTDDELVLLLNGLQKHKERDRFERILEENGSRLGRGLGNRDLDELMQQARWVKHSMKNHMVEGEDDWLISVPG